MIKTKLTAGLCSISLLSQLMLGGIAFGATNPKDASVNRTTQAEQTAATKAKMTALV